MGRRCLIAVAALAAGLVAPTAAWAATVNVDSGVPSNAYTPKDVTITHGDTVTWTNRSGVHNVHLDNDSFDQPPNPISGAWVVSKTFTTTGTYRYYCDIHGSPGGVGMAGTVKVKAPYQTPLTASPLNVSLVPLFKQAGTPGNPTNASHAAPFSVGSSTPPATTAVAHVGTAGAGSAQMAVTPGDVNTAADEANVSFTANATDVRATSPTGPDYNPNPSGPDLTLVTKFRISDLSNGGAATDQGTLTDLDFAIPVDCATTAGGAGSNCSASTTADAVSPGMIKEGRSTLMQAFRVRLVDSGPDNVRGNGDDRLFQQQGILAPSGPPPSRSLSSAPAAPHEPATTLPPMRMRTFHKDYLMTAGPTPLPPAVSQVMAEPILYHRAPAFIEIYERVLEAAAGWSSRPSARCCCSPPPGQARWSRRSRTWSRRATRPWSPPAASSASAGRELCEAYGARDLHLETEWGERIDPDEVERALVEAGGGVKAVFTTHSETSTGVRQRRSGDRRGRASPRRRDLCGRRLGARGRRPPDRRMGARRRGVRARKRRS